MAIESARAFVKKMYEDDAYMKKLFQCGAITSDKSADKAANQRAQSQHFADMSHELGYDFDVTEYDTANNEYIKSLGAWKGIKQIFRMMKIGKAAERESKKAKK